MIQFFPNISAGIVLLLLKQIRDDIFFHFVHSCNLSFLRCFGEDIMFGKDTHTESRVGLLLPSDKVSVLGQVPLAAGCACIIPELGAQKSTLPTQPRSWI